MVMRFRIILSSVIVILMFFTASGAASAQESRKDGYGYLIDTVDSHKIRQLLNDKQFKELNELLASAQKDCLRDFRKEYNIADAVKVFSRTAGIEDLLNEWVKDYAQEWQPYIARAGFYFGLAWASRGEKWAKDTTDQRFKGMSDYLSKARADINSALKLDPKILPAYIMLICMNKMVSDYLPNYLRLIGINKAAGEDLDNALVYKKAIAIFPLSFTLRLEYLYALEPRWGGSYEAMESLVAQNQAVAKQNPRLKLLEGVIAWDQGNAAWDGLDKNKDKDKALALYNTALTAGDYWLFYEARATLYRSLKDYSKAVNDIDRAIELRPQEPDNYYERAIIQFNLKNFEESLNNIETAADIDQLKPEYRELRQRLSKKLVAQGYEATKQKRDDGVINLYDWALKFDPKNAQAYYYKSRVAIDKGDLVQAAKDLDTAIGLDPRYFEAYRLIDWVLFKDKQWDKIIAYWDKYIALEPADARAFLERSGTKFHKGDINGSTSDAQKACTLGNKEGCQALNGRM